MGKYYIEYSCGHSGEVTFFGKIEDREKRIKYLEEYGECPSCKKESERKKMEQIEEEYHLPKIIGVSEKQVFYARSLRYKAVENYKKYITLFLEQLPNSNISIEEIANYAKMKPQKNVSIAYFCCIETDAGTIINALQ